MRSSGDVGGLSGDTVDRDSPIDRNLVLSRGQPESQVLQLPYVLDVQAIYTRMSEGYYRKPFAFIRLRLVGVGAVEDDEVACVLRVLTAG